MLKIAVISIKQLPSFARQPIWLLQLALSFSGWVTPT